MKYVLVHWTAGSLKTSILTEEYVLDKTMLNDPDKEGMVVFVKPGDQFPKHKVKAYLGRVKYVSEHQKIIEEQQRLFLTENGLNSCETSSPFQSRKRKRSESVYLCDTTAHEDDPTEDDQEKKLRTGPSIHILEERIQKLENEIINLRRTNLMLQNDLPNLLRDALQSSPVLELFQKGSPKYARVSHALNYLPTMSRRVTSCSVETTSSAETCRSSAETCRSSAERCRSSAETCRSSAELTSSAETTSSAELTSSAEPTSSAELTSSAKLTSSAELTTFVGTPSSERLNSSSESAAQPKQENQETKLSIKSLPLSNLLTAEQMKCISRAASYKKMTSVLLLSLFGKSLLAKSSVTGKSKAGRPALDREVVGLIIAHVQECFPQTRYQDIKATMAQKCKDLRKSIDRKNTLSSNIQKLESTKQQHTSTQMFTHADI